jgi:DNA-binding winged helix-turn-helix (wHTH) protein
MEVRATVEFEPYRLDLVDESLWRYSERLSLTPKAFAVLRHLVQHAGQLVSRDNLFETIWPDVYVSDDALTVCIRELRQVLGDRAIASVHRNGAGAGLPIYRVTHDDIAGRRDELAG